MAIGDLGRLEKRNEAPTTMRTLSTQGERTETPRGKERIEASGVTKWMLTGGGRRPGAAELLHAGPMRQHHRKKRPSSCHGAGQGGQGTGRDNCVATATQASAPGWHGVREGAQAETGAGLCGVGA
ncbi:hypothetical protein E2562_028171 [Oryza meyeriana var. granulata]|uniref:Uncharacterized protein n=1 Tax=Oryza meyeriana var. granulata TaxID=110450 RepID=A0A6G1CT16_9ORYZ|nr:hypothetical protein E2562_028171 [Oryza meyeriana var. granulata]